MLTPWGAMLPTGPVPAAGLRPGGAVPMLSGPVVPIMPTNVTPANMIPMNMMPMGMPMMGMPMMGMPPCGMPLAGSLPIGIRPAGGCRRPVVIRPFAAGGFPVPESVDPDQLPPEVKAAILRPLDGPPKPAVTPSVMNDTEASMIGPDLPNDTKV